MPHRCFSLIPFIFPATLQQSNSPSSSQSFTPISNTPSTQCRPALSFSNKHTGTQIKYASPLLTAASLLSLLLSSIGDLHSLGLLGLIFEGSGFVVLALHDGLRQSHESLIDVLVGLSRGLSEGNSESLSQLSTLFSGHGLQITTTWLDYSLGLKIAFITDQNLINTRISVLERETTEKTQTWEICSIQEEMLSKELRSVTS